MNKEDFKEEMRETVMVAVKEAFATKISEAEQPEVPEEEEDGEVVEENDDDGEGKGEDPEGKDEDDEGIVEEALKVKATKNGKERDLEVANFKALVQLAKNGGYESFVVDDGKEEIEYAVSNGRLVEL